LYSEIRKFNHKLNTTKMGRFIIIKPISIEKGFMEKVANHLKLRLTGGDYFSLGQTKIIATTSVDIEGFVSIASKIFNRLMPYDYAQVMPPVEKIEKFFEKFSLIKEKEEEEEKVGKVFFHQNCCVLLIVHYTNEEIEGFFKELLTPIIKEEFSGVSFYFGEF